MRAMLCRSFGPPESLTLEELPSAPLGRHDVRIAVRACGVNFPDLLMIAGRYQFKPPLPFSPGGEVAGEIVEVGAAVEGRAVGERVLAICGWNGWRDEAVVPAAAAMAIPDGMEFPTAASLSMTYGTAIHALQDRAGLRAGESLLVLGASGGVGTAAIEVGLALGAKVVAASGRDDKLAWLAERYALAGTASTTGDAAAIKQALKAAAGGEGFDVVFDPIGGDAHEAAVRSLAWGGRMLVVGFAAGEIPSLPANLLLLKGAASVGVFWGSFVARDPAANRRNFDQLFAWWSEGKLAPHVHAALPLTQAAEALRLLEARDVRGKLVLLPSA
jgi:NADPH2:quinone reductase